jgi:hypothetical protein
MNIETESNVCSHLIATLLELSQPKISKEPEKSNFDDNLHYLKQYGYSIIESEASSME